MNTRQKILDKALEMFNERGIEYVGLRELAALLGIRVSNITYYFPTKDDLVYELAQQLSSSNATWIAAQENLTMQTFLYNLQQVFHNQMHYRCLLLSIVHLMQQNKHLAATYKNTQNQRYATLHLNITALTTLGYLNIQEEATRGFLVSTLALFNRFWISEAAVSFRTWSSDAQIRHYLSLITNLLQPYATAKGKQEIAQFLETQKNAPTNNGQAAQTSET